MNIMRSPLRRHHCDSKYAEHALACRSKQTMASEVSAHSTCQSHTLALMRSSAKARHSRAIILAETILLIFQAQQNALEYPVASLWALWPATCIRSTRMRHV